MNARNIPGGKGGQCVRLTIHHLRVPNVMKSGILNLLERSGPHQVCYETPSSYIVHRDQIPNSEQTSFNGAVKTSRLVLYRKVMDVYSERSFKSSCM
jgi:hypothetical protein